MLKKQKIFLTGASGFIGSHLAVCLYEAGYAVTALLRDEPKAFAGRPPLPAHMQRIIGDITRPESYMSALAGHDVLIHLAADYRVGVPATAKARAAMYDVNVRSALLLMEAAAREGVKHLIHTSTTAALGETRGDLPGEDHRHNGRFRCYYEETKHIIHELLLKRQAKGLPVSLAILGGVTGPGDSSALAFALTEYLRGKLPFQVATSSRFQLCGVENICEAYLCLLEKNRPGSKYIFTGSDFSMPELFGRMAKKVEKAEPKQVSPALLRIPALCMDISARLGLKTPLSCEALNIMDGSTYTYSAAKAEKELGWRCGDMDAYLDAYMDSLIRDTA